MIKLKCMVTFSLIVFLILTITGCLAAVATGVGAAGAVLWYQGELRADLDAAPKKVIAATERAFADLKWSKISVESFETEGKAIAQTDEDQKVEVTVKQKTETTSEIGIRVGIIGDENLSRTLLEKIEAYIK